MKARFRLKLYPWGSVEIMPLNLQAVSQINAVPGYYYPPSLVGKMFMLILADGFFVPDYLRTGYRKPFDK